MRKPLHERRAVCGPHLRQAGVAAALTVLMAILLASPARADTSPAPSPSKAHDAAVKMGPGVNILGYDGLWKGQVNAPFKISYFKRIREAGFRHVRINLHAFKYMDDRGLLDEKVLNRLDYVIYEAVRAGLIPVLDEHDFRACQADPEACAAKLEAFWTQISERFAGRYPSLIFELLNEPGGKMPQEVWNALALDLLVIVRRSNPERTVIIAALNSGDIEDLGLLELPKDDRNIILTVHYYSPMAFTHQGASWSRHADGRNVPWGSAEDRRKVRDDFARMDQLAKAKGRPVYLGEFGVYDAARMDDRARYLSFLARQAEAYGWPWAYWQFDHDFAVFDSKSEQWVEPVLSALLPGAAQASSAVGVAND